MCISLMIRDIDQLFMSLVAIYNFSGRTLCFEVAMDLIPQRELTFSSLRLLENTSSIFLGDADYLAEEC